MMATFPAAERIKSKIVLEELYQKGESLNHFPFRLKFMRHNFEDGTKVKIAISVPKRNVRKAVKRNRLKRQIKEAYRLNKSSLLSQFEAEAKGLALFLIYTGKQDQDYHFIEAKLIELLKKLQSKL